MTILRLTEEQYAARLAQKRARGESRLVPPIVGEANAAAAPAPSATRKQAKSRPKSCAGAILEADVLRAILAYLKIHPAVALAWRANTGAFTLLGASGKQRHVRAGFAGCPDILGMLKGGRFLAIEVKRPGGRLSTAQHAFLYRVEHDGGLGFMAESVADVQQRLAGIARMSE